MQTFLPYDDFRYSAHVLDRQRLGKQRVEVLQLLNALTGEGRGWTNHPAAKMWRGYELALAAYGIVICSVWIERGYRDTCTDKIKAMVPGLVDLSRPVMPSWFGFVDFHLSHRSNLVRKNPEHYIPHFGPISPDMEYIWPVP